MIEEFSAVLERAEEQAAERERRMREVELKMEQEIREREDKWNDRMLNTLITIMLQLAGASGQCPSYSGTQLPHSYRTNLPQLPYQPARSYTIPSSYFEFPPNQSSGCSSDQVNND